MAGEESERAVGCRFPASTPADLVAVGAWEAGRCRARHVLGRQGRGGYHLEEV
jgi:hypothetical protein